MSVARPFAQHRPQLVMIAIVVVREHSRRLHTQARILRCAIGVVMRMRPVRGIADLQRDRSRGFCAGRILDDILELDLSRIVVLGRIMASGTDTAESAARGRR